MDGPGTITWEEFLQDAENFLSVSKKISDGWEIHGDKSEPGGAYLFRRAKQFVSHGASSTSEDDDFKDEWKFNLKEDRFAAETAIERPLVMEHHVLWSMSYSVPVLYFNGWYSDFPGINPVTVEEAQALVSGDCLNYMELSQGIHPVLGTPLLQLHPCASRDLLQNTRKSKNKLVSWLSMMAPAALGLKVRPEYCQLTL